MSPETADYWLEPRIEVRDANVFHVASMMGWTLEYVRSLSLKDYNNLLIWVQEENKRAKIHNMKQKRKKW